MRGTGLDAGIVLLICLFWVLDNAQWYAGGLGDQALNQLFAGHFHAEHSDLAPGSGYLSGYRHNKGSFTHARPCGNDVHLSRNKAAQFFIQAGKSGRDARCCFAGADRFCFFQYVTGDGPGVFVLGLHQVRCELPKGCFRTFKQFQCVRCWVLRLADQFLAGADDLPLQEHLENDPAMVFQVCGRGYAVGVLHQLIRTAYFFQFAPLAKFFAYSEQVNRPECVVHLHACGIHFARGFQVERVSITEHLERGSDGVCVG